MKLPLANTRLQRIPRTRGVTLLAVGVLIMACLHLTRAVLALRDWAFLSQQPGVAPLYLLLTGLAWATVSWLVWIGLWWGKPWAPDRMRGFSLVYSLFAWLERLFLYDRPSGAPLFLPLLPGNWIFLFGFNLLVLIFVFWILESNRKHWGAE